MKLRFFQPQELIRTSGATKFKWYDNGPAILQYFTEEDGYWQEVEVVKQSEEAQYDGEREMR